MIVEDLQTRIDNGDVIEWHSDGKVLTIVLDNSYKIDKANNILCHGNTDYWNLDDLYLPSDQIQGQIKMDFDKVGVLSEGMINSEQPTGEVVDPLTDLRNRVSDLEDQMCNVGKFINLTTGTLIQPLYESIAAESAYNNRFGRLKSSEQFFTEDEKVILRMVRSEYKYLVRDLDGFVSVFDTKPQKTDFTWIEQPIEGGKDPLGLSHLFPTELMFQNIKWRDDKPCEFRKYL